MPGLRKSISPWPSRASCAVLVEDDSAVHFGGDAEADAGGHIGFDKSGDDGGLRTLGGEDDVDADGAAFLCEADDVGLDFLRSGHHKVCQLVYDDNDIRYFFRDFCLFIRAGRLQSGG